MEHTQQIKRPLETIAFSGHDPEGAGYERETKGRGFGMGDLSKGLSKTSRVKLAFGSMMFLVLTLGIFLYQFVNMGEGYEPTLWQQLRWDYFLLIVLIIPLDTLSSGLRMRLISGVLEPGISFWTCLKAEWANIGVSMLTPSQTGGGFGQMYILYRGGASLDTALTISLISFLGTMVGLLCIGLYALVFSGLDQLGTVFLGALWFFTLISALMVSAAVWPALFGTAIERTSMVISRFLQRTRIFAKVWTVRRNVAERAEIETLPHAKRLVEFIFRYSVDVRRFLRLGKTRFCSVCILSLVFLFSRALMAFLCLRFLGIEVSGIGQVLETQLVLLFIIYFAPTPGGSGIAEGASLGMMAQIVPLGVAPYYNLLWRTNTLFLPACLGLFILLRTVMHDTHRVFEGRHAFNAGQKQPSQ